MPKHMPVSIVNSVDEFYRIRTVTAGLTKYVATSQVSGFTSQFARASVWRDADEAKQFAHKRGFDVLPV